MASALWAGDLEPKAVKMGLTRAITSTVSNHKSLHKTMSEKISVEIIKDHQ